MDGARTVPARESQTYEAKQSVGERREIVQTVAAFATAQGGLVEIGVSPDGSVVGVDIGQSTLENLANDIRQNTDPRQGPSVAVDRRDGRQVIRLYVPESGDKPVAAFGVPYKRVGPSNHRLSMTEVRHLIAETGVGRWEDHICERATMADISRDAIARFLDRTRRAGRLDDISAEASEETLRRLGVASDDGLKNAAIALFGEDPTRFFPQLAIKCAVFRGVQSVDFVDELTREANILAQIESALGFIDRNMRHAIKFTGAAQREDHWDYPLEAVREAVVNAVCHRDYENTGHVQVRMYDDRLEVWNPGMLVPGLTVEALMGTHTSQARNPAIAGCLYRAGHIERWGTGTNRMIRECVEALAPAPVFAENTASSAFVVTLGKTARPAEHRLTERQAQVMDYVREHGEITQTTHKELTGVGSTAAKNDLRALVELGLLRRLGGSRSIRYVLAGE